ncbi:MAG: hypothetical protein ACP5GI_00440 [Sulfolobales archaeon]
MIFRSVIFGSMPRSRRLARAISRYQSNKIDVNALEEVYRKDLRKFLEYVYTNNIYRSSDGMYRWDDLFNPLANYMSLDVNGLKRFYDNNFFFRQPIFNKSISYEEPKISKTMINDIKIIGFSNRVERISLTLPGPLTLVMNSLIDEGLYTSKIKVAEEYVEKVVIKEITYAYREGVRHIDLHEPELAFSKISPEILDLYKRIAENFGGNIWIIIYFGYDSDNIQLLRKLSEEKKIIPVVDLVSTKPSIDKVAEDLRGLREYGLGILDSRNTKIEVLKELRSVLEKVEKESRDTEYIYITHNSNLEFLPEKIAFRKIKLLSRLVS